MRLRPVNDGWYEISVSLASCSSVIFSTSASGCSARITITCSHS